MEVPEGFEMVYEGWNGAVYHWSGGELQSAEGVGLATGDAGTMFEDMYESPFDTIYNSTAFEIGARYGGSKELMMEFSLVFHIKNNANTPWRIVDSRFRKSLHKQKDSKIRVKIVGESERWLAVRMRATPKLKVKLDPNGQKYGLLIVHFCAPYPRWIEDDYTQTYTTTTDTRVSGEEHFSFLASNPTNNEAWIKYVLQAGNADIIYTLPDFSFGDDRFNQAVAHDDRMIEMPELDLGEHVVVDTDEMTMAGQVVSSTDTQVYQRMDGREFLYPLPAYTEPISLPCIAEKADIGNVIQMRIPRHWSRPWGLE